MNTPHLKKGVYQGCFPVSVDMQGCINWAKKFGFDGLEISMEDPSPLMPEALNETTAEILARLSSPWCLAPSRFTKQKDL